MYTCPECKGHDFEKYDGFLYCSQCHVQYPDYCEEVVEVDPKSSQQTFRSKKKSSIKVSASDGWTSWDLWNYILFGMVQELKSLVVVPLDFEEVVLKLWACLLQKSNVAFLSRYSEKLPALRPENLINARDFKELFGIDLTSQKKVKKRLKSVSSHSGTSGSSGSSKFFGMKRKLKKKIIDMSYNASSINDTVDKLLDETIESIKLSQDTSILDSQKTITEMSLSSKSASESTTKKGFQRFLKDHIKNKPKKLKANVFSKSKLLGIIHLALLLTRSRVHLSDLLRFIREGHLAYAKVTHFLPEQVQLTKADAFFETTSNVSMPTHLNQRKVVKQLARIMGIQGFQEIDIETLIHRYCADLHLPDQIRECSIKLFECADIKKLEVLDNKSHLPNYEALAMASILFVMKFFFCLDGTTEYLLSDLGEKINRAMPNAEMKAFVFSDWQKHLMCRSTLLQDFHYPTEERTMEECTFKKSTGLLGMIEKEDKDKNRANRFKDYKRNNNGKKALNAVREVLEKIQAKIESPSLTFPPSLTPQTFYLSIILEWWEEKLNDDNLVDQLEAYDIPPLKPASLSILKENFKHRHIDFIFNPEKYRKYLVAAKFKIEERTRADYLKLNLIPKPGQEIVDCDSLNEATNEWKHDGKQKLDAKNLSLSNKVIFLNDISHYWILRRSSDDKKHLDSFKINVFDNTSVTFQWLLTQCAMMLEMNTREIYHELRFLERKLLFITRRL